MKLVFDKRDLKSFKRSNGGIRPINFVILMSLYSLMITSVNVFATAVFDGFDFRRLVIVAIVALPISLFSGLVFKYNKFNSDEMKFETKRDCELYFPVQLEDDVQKHPCGVFTYKDNKFTFDSTAIYSDTVIDENIESIEFVVKKKRILDKLMYKWEDHQMIIRYSGGQVIFNIPCPDKVKQYMTTYGVI